MDDSMRTLCRQLDGLVLAAIAVMKTIDDPEAGPAAAQMQAGQLNLPWHAGCRAALDHLRTHPDVAQLRDQVNAFAALTQPALATLDQERAARPHPWETITGKSNGHAAAAAGGER